MAARLLPLLHPQVPSSVTHSSKMLIGYGYGYPTSMLQGGVAAGVWALFNARATADGATAAEAAVDGCLFNRFAVIYNF